MNITNNIEKKAQDITYLIAYANMIVDQQRPQDLGELLRKYESQSGKFHSDLTVNFNSYDKNFTVYDKSEKIIHVLNENDKLTRLK